MTAHLPTASSAYRRLQFIPFRLTDALSPNRVKTIIALISEETISQGEYTVAYLQTVRPDLVLIGTTTSGTLGNPTNIQLPGNILVSFTGVGILARTAHQQTKAIQGKGIEPTIEAKETIAGITSGKDTIFEAALRYVSESSTSSH